MFFLKPLSFAREFIKKLNEALCQLEAKPLSKAQMVWLSICITGIIVTNSVCWKRFERAGFGKFSSGTISAMFKRASISWSKLLLASIKLILKEYGITEGILALDGTDNKRSKNTKNIPKVHTIKDKSSGGFIKGQELTILVLITEKVTIPVGFEFYEPDPVCVLWKKNDKALRKQGVSKKNRPPEPQKNPKYPSPLEVGLEVLKGFKKEFPEIKVKAVLADALYGASTFFKPASRIFPGVQIISQVKKTQMIRMHGKFISVEEYFRRNTGVSKSMKIRGGKEENVIMHGARLYLKAHGCKRFIIALKYEGEEEYRYLMASDLTWRLTDIAAAYTIRWLVEVFIQDWKSYEGWCNLAKQPGEEGSRRGVILSLLVDHSLLLHPDQLALVKNKLPASTVGSLRDKERAKAIIEAIESILPNESRFAKIVSDLQKCVNDSIILQPSKKHMCDKVFGRLEPTPSLKYQAVA
jgi:hypothetical protein